MGIAKLINYRILIVDDQANNLRVLTAVLEFAGYNNVHCLSDSRQVLCVFQEFQPDIVLLDLHMPHVDGLAAMDQLATVTLKDDYLPILVLTGDVTSEAKERALSHGAHDFLSKPLNRMEVQLRVKNLLQTRQMHLRWKVQNAVLEQQVREGTELAEELGRTNQMLRETQVHLIHSEKMAGLGQLVAGIAHEINNPLAFVINNIFIIQEVLRKLAAKGTELPIAWVVKIDKMTTRINEAHDGAARIKDLVSKLRTFSRLDEGPAKAIDIHEGIESVLLFLGQRLAGRIQIERNYGKVPMVTCFSGELNQALMNIVANGIDAIDGPGRITITTAQENDYFVIRVRDTGAGIPKEIQNRIFDPFFTTKPIGQGAGLGLTISYGIVKAHHGSIDVSSEAGQGAEFILKIPISLRQKAQPAFLPQAFPGS